MQLPTLDSAAALPYRWRVGDARNSEAERGGTEPPVSLILLTWNQERFVAEAVEAALAQDYSNLEILISDHGSSDRTFEIAQAIVRAYSGPHRVRLNRSVAEGGVLGHVREAIAKTSGGLIVGAAGDDVSLPHRVSMLAERWKRTGAAVLASPCRWIDAEGRAIARPAAGPQAHDLSNYFPDGGVFHLHGATAAYDRTALAAIHPPPFDVTSEDFFLSLMLALRSARFERVDEPLLACRIHPGAISSRGGSGPTLEARERAVAAYSERTARLLRHAERAARTGEGFDPGFGRPARVDLQRLAADAAFHEARAGWYRRPFRARLAAMRHVRSLGQLRWMLPRLGGLKLLGAIRRLAGRE